MKSLSRAECPDCSKAIRIKRDGTIRPHGHPADRCTGGGFYVLGWRSKPTPEGRLYFARTTTEES